LQKHTLKFVKVIQEKLYVFSGHRAAVYDALSLRRNEATKKVTSWVSRHLLAGLLDIMNEYWWNFVEGLGMARGRNRKILVAIHVFIDSEALSTIQYSLPSAYSSAQFFVFARWRHHSRRRKFEICDRF